MARRVAPDLTVEEFDAWSAAHDNNEPAIPFTPIPLRPRQDGWTPEQQIAFIEALAETGWSRRPAGASACRTAPPTGSAAGPAARPFARRGTRRSIIRCTGSSRTPLARARNGVTRPIFHKGEQVGEWRHYDERLTMFLLRTRRPERYGKWIERILAPEDKDSQKDAAIRLDGGLERIEWQSEPDEARKQPEDCRRRPRTNFNSELSCWGQSEDEARRRAKIGEAWPAGRRVEGELVAITPCDLSWRSTTCRSCKDQPMSSSPNLFCRRFRAARWRSPPSRPSSNGTTSPSTSISRPCSGASSSAAAALSLLTTLGGFAVAYLMRPLGAVVFGHIGDRYGRRRMLLLSVAVMTAAMLATALLPTSRRSGRGRPGCCSSCAA